MKLLLVEDDMKIATAVQRGLEAEGFTVEVAFDGDDGLWLATEGSYDLIVLDIMLPGRNGFQICADLREAGDWTPILMLTAKDGDLDEAEALDTGADDYLTKPFSFPVLVARSGRCCAARPGATRRPVAVGDLRIDPGARRVWRGDIEVVLTAREFDVLEFLVRRAGQVLSKAEILAGVWDYDFDGDPNIVEVYVGRLRRKVDEPFGAHTDRDGPRRRLPPGGDVIARLHRPGAHHAAGDGASWPSCWCSPALGLVVQQRRVLTEALDESLEQRADEIARAGERRAGDARRAGDDDASRRSWTRRADGGRGQRATSTATGRSSTDGTAAAGSAPSTGSRPRGQRLPSARRATGR